MDIFYVFRECPQFKSPCSASKHATTNSLLTHHTPAHALILYETATASLNKQRNISTIRNHSVASMNTMFPGPIIGLTLILI